MKLPSRLVRGSVRPDANSLRRFASLRWAALPIVDRRWTAPLSAIALGFGLFVGVAIGPGTEGTFGTAKPMVIRLPAPPETQTAAVPPANANGPSGHSGDHQSNDQDQTPPPALDPPPAVEAPSFDTPPAITTPPTYPTTPSYPSTPTYPTTPSTTSTTTTTPTETDPAETTTAFSGTVLHLNPEAASYALATDDGQLVALHSHRPPVVGKRVEVDGKPLANGTYSEVGNRKEVGNAGRADFSGTVSYSDPVNRVYTVSAPGVSALVRGGANHRPPEVGDEVDVRARIADHPEALTPSEPGQQGCGQPPVPPKAPKTALDQLQVETTSDEPSTSTDVEGIVEGVCRSDRKLIVSADDVRESGQDISIAIPEDFKLASLKPGLVLKLGADIGAAGALTLSSVAGDEGAKGAEDSDLVQP